MLVRSLEVVHYPRGGTKGASSRWETITHANPDWQTIVFWIERLDRDVHPFLWLQIGKHVEQDEPELALNVMGGRGEFALCIFARGSHLYYRDESRSDKVVQIWESDQGSHQREKDLCNDLETVLKVAKHFAETGEPFPGVNWVEN